MSQRVIGVIPARLNSTRLPRKMLREICGKALVVHVFEAAARCTLLHELVVATDAEEIRTACLRAGIPVMMTSPEHTSGTDRLHEVANAKPADVYVNVQGDEPLIEPAHLERLVTPFGTDPTVQVTTLRVPIPAAEAQNPNVVKVVCSGQGRAIYFSRCPIPHDRDGRGDVQYYKHLGLYAYRRDALSLFHRLPPTPLERTERLEQLRLLENGVSILVGDAPFDTVGVDTEADLERVQRILAERGGLRTAA
jgi:3-deoxy-manno-octulosonate cytidylyltransferase (CMP-KDO synthetase)